MFTFKNATFLFFLLLLGTHALWLTTEFSGSLWLRPAGRIIEENRWMIYALLTTSYLLPSIVLAFFPCSGFHHAVICKGDHGSRVVAITFDDGPDPVSTPGILDILDRHRVKAAFFCIGRNVASNEELIRRINNEGHILGNHGFSHQWWFDFKSSGAILNEIVATDKAILKTTGRTPAFFRPPFGVINPLVSRALRNSAKKAVCWNIRSFDTMGGDSERIFARIMGKLSPGSIILLHDHSPFVKNHLNDLIVRITEKGYSIVPLDRVINNSAYVQTSS